MTYRTLSLQCRCGRASGRIREVGFTADHQLVLHWRCPDCKSYVYGLKPLDDCWEACPTEEELQEAAEPGEGSVAETDVRFLQKLGVRFPDDPDSIQA